MATYFHSESQIQPEGLRTLYLMNPSYNGCTGINLTPTTNHQQPPQLTNQQQHFVGIPIQQDSGYPQSIHDVSLTVQGLVPRLHYNLWTPPPQPLKNSSTEMLTDHLGLSRRETELNSAQQALSLRLSPHEVVSTVNSGIGSALEAGEVKVVGICEEGAGLQSFLMGSKCLKAAQELLDEVVNVGTDNKGEGGKRVSNFSNKMKNSSNKDSESAARAVDEESSGKRIAADIASAERQGLQMKKAKLGNMLHEVEHRYRQYYHQMQIVVSSFEAIAGPGSARTYTALALQTISKQFRCLRDAIVEQIRSTSKKLGDEETKTVGSRLRFVDHQLRQKKTLQQLGIIQHNAWRPQRGLPERSVSILRAWLFENFLHPYPKDSDKIMLAKQTGLTRSQVSNWFINARVRLWKPMVEEMYSEEIKDQEQNNDEDNSMKSDVNRSPSTKSNAQQESSRVTEGPNDNLKSDQGQESTLVLEPYLNNGMDQASYYDNETSMQPGLKMARINESLQANAMPHSISMDLKSVETNNQEFFLKFVDGRPIVGDQSYSLIPPGATSHGGNNNGAFTIGELGRFNAAQYAPMLPSNGVSLTLGLQHCENLSLSGAEQSFLPNNSMQPLTRRLEISSDGRNFFSLNNNATVAHSSGAYENINMQNRKRFSAQLLPDYVA